MSKAEGQQKIIAFWYLQTHGHLNFVIKFLLASFWRQNIL
jgi:hypothetical protein